MKVKLSIAAASDAPIFQQIVDGVERLILAGKIAEGEFLPSVRDFAVHHSVNPNTVSKAYQVLQSQGWVEAVRGLGLRVCKAKSSDVSKRRDEILQIKVEELLAIAGSLGVSSKDLMHLIQKLEREGGK